MTCCRWVQECVSSSPWSLFWDPSFFNLLCPFQFSGFLFCFSCQKSGALLTHSSHNSPTSGAKQQEDRERKNPTRFIHLLGIIAPLIAEKNFHSTEFQVFVGPAAATTTTVTSVGLPAGWDMIEWRLKKIKRNIGDFSHTLWVLEVPGFSPWANTRGVFLEMYLFILWCPLLVFGLHCIWAERHSC